MASFLPVKLLQKDKYFSQTFAAQKPYWDIDIQFLLRSTLSYTIMLLTRLPLFIEPQVYFCYYVYRMVLKTM